MTSAMTRLTLIFALALLMVAQLIGQQADQRSFASPQEAAQALMDAASQNNTAALRKLFGSQSTDIVQSGDPAGSHEDWRMAF